MNYRFDSRSEDQFKKDIKSSTMTERALFLLWLDLIERETGTRPDYVDTGCGKNGEFLEDSAVSADPDFSVSGYGNVEVKFSKPMIKDDFHLKVSQVKKYQEKKTTILMVNGIDHDVPQFTMIKPEALANVTAFCEKVPWRGFGGKMAYKIPVGMFIWRPLK